ncbi:DUF4382 domain-containing protein [Piscinibacter sp. HJYY11]|uniref:DUF4382 domain-containing protein n=1 Tax=Piscinibacter sp. HJYY11 TaxID=2801333 RepID=UPI00191EEBFA|nr:DUF4382 domain-containing protein [Piscinibacter sp. HJYY11]MBL0730086.1 DUF4382 domain-containing protein [Piscinibacter sp. HJYY11]
MKLWTRHFRIAAVAVAATIIGACGGGSDSGGTGAGSGTLRVALTDAPACGYDHVYVTVDRVRVHQSSTATDADAGWAEVVLPTPRRIDLLSLTNGVLDELGQTPLPAGRYTQLRLVLAPNGNGNATPIANAIRLTGDTQDTPLVTPSGQQSGLKMNVNIDVAANQMVDAVLDFDACKSIVRAGNSGRWLLKPVIRVIPRYISGVLGHVDLSLVGPGTTVSLQQAGVVVRSTVPDATGRFLLQPVAPGTYDLVLSAPGRTTTVITGVPVTADTVLSLNTAAAALVSAPSPNGVASGSITVTPAGPLDANVRALQAVGAATVEVASTLADEGTGLYSLTLPTAAPLMTSYAVPLPPATPASASAGRYTLQATLGGVTKATAAPVAVSASAPVVTGFSFP